MLETVLWPNRYVEEFDDAFRPGHHFVMILPIGSLISDRKRLQREVEEWCVDQFGWDETRWSCNGPLAWLVDRADATAFKLRWC